MPPSEPDATASRCSTTSSTRRSRASSSWPQPGAGDRRRRRPRPVPPARRRAIRRRTRRAATRPRCPASASVDRRHPPRLGVVRPGDLDRDRGRHRQRVHLATEVGHLGVEHVQRPADGGGELAHLVCHVPEVPEAQRPQTALDRRAAGTTRLDGNDGVDEDRRVDEPEHVCATRPPDRRAASGPGTTGRARARCWGADRPRPCAAGPPRRSGGAPRRGISGPSSSWSGRRRLAGSTRIVSRSHVASSWPRSTCSQRAGLRHR